MFESTRVLKSKNYSEKKVLYDNFGCLFFGLIYTFVEKVGRGKGDIYQDCGNFYFYRF
jgi:hypothetical protein